MKIVRKKGQWGDVRWEMTKNDNSRVNATFTPGTGLSIYSWGPRGGARGGVSLPMEMLRELAKEIPQDEGEGFS